MKLRDTAAFRTEFAEDNEKDEKTSHSLLAFLVLLVPCVGTRISLYCISPSFLRLFYSFRKCLVTEVA